MLRDGYETACAKGFAPATWDALPSKIAFTFTELREAELAAHSDVVAANKGRETRHGHKEAAG